MSVGWSPIYESFYFRCIYGCEEADFEGRQEAEEAFLTHSCVCAGEVCS